MRSPLQVRTQRPPKPSGDIELDPSMEEFHEGFAGALLKSGDLSGAEPEYRASLLSMPLSTKTASRAIRITVSSRAWSKVKRLMAENTP
jgi:hypothetical protein